MRRLATPLVIVLCVLGLSLACFGRALFRDEQFGYRDAAHFYYPLYQRVQTEWQAGRWPLWEPEENGGMPLLGNPTAAVLYPGKVIYAVLPYAAAAKVYVVAHTILAFLGTFLLLRGWKSSWEGSALGGLSYAFGAPVLFQYCNIIYLVGAAWLPFGFLAVDRRLRLGSRRALLGLAVVLAMETLGGDPEMAYLTGLCAVGYAVLLTRARRAENQVPAAWGGVFNFLIGLTLLVVWVVATLAMARLAPTVRAIPAPGQPAIPLPWMSYVAPGVALSWSVVGALMIGRWRKARRRSRPEENVRNALVPMLAGLFASAVLAGTLTAAQLLPVMEFTGLSSRAASDGPHEIFAFSLEPLRVVEFIWPNFFGTPFQGNRSWMTMIWLTGKSVKTWVPSLYVGVMTLVLALGALRLRKSPTVDTPWRVWISMIALAGLVAAFGEFTSPIYWGRFSPEVAKVIGPHDDELITTIRADRYLRDGDGSIYWGLATFLPGFRQFRFPCKLLTLTVLAMAVLAGQGWDGLMAGDSRTRRRGFAWAVALLVLTAVVFTITIVQDAAILRLLKSHDRGSSFGPLDTAGALSEMRWGLVQSGVLIALTIALIVFGRRRPRIAGNIALIAMAADLGLANSRYVMTVPQALFEGTPEVIRLINEAEKSDPFPGPFRVHRMPIWNPPGWLETAGTDRVRDFVEWERKTIQPKYGINEGIQYTMTMGVAELYDYEWFFGGFARRIDEEGAQALNLKVGDKVVVFPRRAFDIWNTRYFVTPSFANSFKEEHRSFASFLDKSDVIAPTVDAFSGPDREAKRVEYVKTLDYQILRNRACYPRAWAVHQARFLPPTTNLSREGRNAPIQEMLYSAEPFWREGSRTVFDPKSLVWVENDAQVTLQGAFSNLPSSPRENVRITKYEPDRVELEANLDTPGMVVLADVYYPGWTLTIDGKPSPIHRANRMMRGAAVPSGKSKLVYSYQPRLFRIGLWVSGLGLAVLVGSALFFAVRPGRDWSH